MIEGIPNWLAVPLALFGIIVGAVFFSLARGQFRPSSRRRFRRR